MKKTNLLFLTLVLLVFLSASLELSAGGLTFGVSARYQEHSQWCWDGCSQCILYYNGRYPSQCEIANWAWGRSDCCYSSSFNWNHTCNSPNWIYGTSGSMQSVLSNWGVSSYGSGSYLGFSTCKSEINGYRPFVIGFTWSGGGGHVMVCYGWWDTGSYWLAYFDPWPGEGYTWSGYNWTVSASDHYWDSTLRTY